MTTFSWPWMFFALPLPLLVYFVLPRVRASAGMALKIPFYRELDGFYPNKSGKSSTWIRLLVILAWILLVGAAARPQWIGKPLSTPISGRDLLLAVDISGSM
ncbi:MAG: BatB protein, partial [Pseudomonadota bacterium]|nr:BatB protein [Pseudomonadota bacterium]